MLKPDSALAVGMAATEFGFRLSDLGEVFRYGSGSAAPGLWLMTAAWVLGAGGAALAVLATRAGRDSRSTPVEDGPSDLPVSMTATSLPAAGSPGVGLVVVIALLALATAGAFLPAWDHYAGVATTTGRTVSFNLGDAFSGPWQVVIGTVFVALVLAVIPLAATRLRSRAAAAALVAGSLIVLATQFIAAVVQVDRPVPPSVAGLSPTQANQLGLQLHMTLTGWFTLDLRWTVNLIEQVSATAATYAGKTSREKLLASDGELFAFLEHVREAVAQRPGRVFFTSDFAYFRVRAGYHLLPFNSVANAYHRELYDPVYLRPGDYICFFARSGMHYDPEKQMLSWDGRAALRVEPIGAQGFGALFRVQG